MHVQFVVDLHDIPCQINRYMGSKSMDLVFDAATAGVHYSALRAPPVQRAQLCWLRALRVARAASSAAAGLGVGRSNSRGRVVNYKAQQAVAEVLTGSRPTGRRLKMRAKGTFLPLSSI
jgi:hypothetical protein